MTSVVSPDATARRETFFKIIYGQHEGYVCIARRPANTRTMHEEFFHYPEELEAMGRYIESYVVNQDLYYCPQLFGEKTRKKEYVTVTPTLWADLDMCSPDQLRVEPSIVLESSPKRYQALWICSPTPDPPDAEDACRRIAYGHAEEGADKSGWDLTQLLRIPGTYNHKYSTNPLSVVRILKTGGSDYPLSAFDVYEQVTGFEYADIPFPSEPLKLTSDEILQASNTHLSATFWRLYGETPDKDWSKALWQVELFLAEAGLSREEMYVVASEAACNKYKRDDRHSSHLWREVCKAFAKVEERSKYLPTGEFRDELPNILTTEERLYCRQNPTVVERYVEWAKSVGDAAWQYHQAGIFCVLSSLLAGRVRLPTSFGVLAPNLWFMILADTTLTRKSTAMNMSADILLGLDKDALLATDGSIEGLMNSLSFRPGRPSLFLRDEFSGLLEAMVKKDYYAGMQEAFCHLYDGRFQKRVLKKEVIEVRDPCLIFFAGGIKTRVLELLTSEQISSGFIPRFCIISAESDTSDLRPLGPPTSTSVAGREAIIEELRNIAVHYIGEVEITTDNKTIVLPRKWDAELTESAWYRYNKYAADMQELGLKLQNPDLATPLFSRLCSSGLKIATLLAAARKLERKVIVEDEDIIRAFFYIEQWRPHSLEVLKGVGLTAGEKNIGKVLKLVRKKSGIKRSEIMQYFHLTAQQTDAIFMTLEQRGLIMRTKDGRTERLTAVEGNEG